MAKHPWEMTFQQFLARARSEYGLETRTLRETEHGLYLVQGYRILALPAIQEDEVLEPEVLENLCRLFGLPPLDFGLDPDPTD